MTTSQADTMDRLLAHGDFVRALARQLTSGGDDADDLAQDAWVRALRHGQNVQQPRSWLARVVRGAASNRRRDIRRRERRERAAADLAEPQSPSTTEILACEEVRQRVVAAVLALDEPFRGAVLARFYECLSSEEIAARHGIAVATVRSRVKRGLDHLRTRLDARSGGRRDAWAGPLLLLATDPLPTPAPAPALALLAMSTPKKLLVAAALMLLAFSAWVATANLWRSPEQPAAAPTTERVGAMATGEGRVDETGERDREAVTTPVVNANATADRGHRFPVTDEPTVPVDVLVLDDESGAPVANADLFFLPVGIDFRSPAARRDRALQENWTSDAFLRREGEHAKTDADGRARIRLPLTGNRVLAALGDRTVREHIRPTDLIAGQPATLWLGPARWLRIRLVDDGGAPVAGKLIEYSNGATGTLVPEQCGYGGKAGPSDENGIIRLRARIDRDRFHVRPRTVGQSPYVRLDLESALHRVTELRYPATGTVTVELRSPSGRPVASEIDAWVAPIPLGHPSELHGASTWTRSEPGTLHVPEVELNQTLDVSARIRTPSFRAERQIQGPTEPGEELRVVMTTDLEPCEVRARLAFPDGTPAAERSVRINAKAGRRRCLHQAVTDAEGHVRWVVPVGGALAGTIQLESQPSQHGERQQQCTFELERAAAGELHDLGTLTLTGDDVVVAGTLDIDDSRWSGPPVKVVVEVPHETRGWHWLGSVTVHPGYDPTFTLRGSTTAERVRVRVAAAGHFIVPQPIETAPGDDDVTVRIERGQPLTAKVIAPAAHARSIDCRVVRHDGASLPRTSDESDDGEPRRETARLVDCRGDTATFSWPALPPGNYRVEIRAPGMPAPVVSLDGVLVEPGALPDPRLDPIDLRPHIRILRVQVAPLPSGPQPVTAGGAFTAPAGDATTARDGLMFDANGRADLLVGPGPVDVVAAMPGHRLWRRPAVSADSVQVTFEPCLEVPVRLAPNVAARFAGCRVDIQLEPREGERESALVRLRRRGRRELAVHTRTTRLQALLGTGSGTIVDAATGRGTVPISAPGMFSVGVKVHGAKHRVHVDERFTSWRRNPVSPQRVSLSGDGDPEIVIDIEDEVITKALERLARRR